MHSHLVYFSRFGTLYQEKSGNPGLAAASKKRATAGSYEKEYDNGSAPPSRCWLIRQDSTSSDRNASRSQNECIGIISVSLYTQANKRGIEECMGENREREKG
jgi:hypothetical protein